MHESQPLTGIPDGLPASPGPGCGQSNALNAIFHDLLETREARQLLITALPALINVWTGKSWWRQKVSGMVGNEVARRLSRPEDKLGKPEIKSLFEDERFIKIIVDVLPDLINGLSEILETSGQTLEKMSADDKKALLVSLFAGTGQGRTGSLLTSCARVLNDIHQEDPEFLARTLEPGFKRWVESMDFGELKETLENSARDTRALVNMANNVIWEYPAKVVLLLSLIPTLANTSAEAVEISVGKLNAVPPDLLTDIVLAFIKEIDGSTVARMFAELSEVLRKIHTGSALLGEPGVPQLPNVLADMFDTIITKTDPTAFWKAKIALAELKASFDGEWSKAVNSHPEHARIGLNSGSELFNIRMRSKNQKMAFWDTMDDDELASCIAQILSGYDAQETAEVFNNVLVIANRLNASKPDICTEFIRQFIDAVDHDELAGLARQVLGEMREELRPMARAVVPGLVEWVCDTLQPEDDEFEEDAARARGALRALLVKEEA